MTGRASLVERALDADERVQLQVLRAATEPNAPLYAAVLSVLVTAKERYQVQVRTEDVARDLSAAGWDVAALTSTLEQLKDWGAVTWAQDTSRVARLEDFNRRRELWQLTPAGQAAHESVVRVLGAADQAGSLQRALFRDIRENLDALAAAVDSGDATATYLRLRDLDGARRDLAANAGDFHSTMAELRRENELAPERFLAYKHLLIDYLQQFLDDLFRYRSLIAAQVAGVEERGLERLVELAAGGDDSGGLFADRDMAAVWRGRWAGLAGWFRAGPQRATAGADDLAAATSAFRTTSARTKPTRISPRPPRAGGVPPPSRYPSCCASTGDAPLLPLPPRPPTTTWSNNVWPRSTINVGRHVSMRPLSSPLARSKVASSPPGSSPCCSSCSTAAFTKLPPTPSSRLRSRPKA